MARNNEILGEIAKDALAPIFWADRNGTFIAVDWAEGFLQAIKLRADAWKPLFTSKRDGKLLLLILLLCGDHDGNSLLGLAPEAEDHIADQVTELIPGCVIGIAAYWRRKGVEAISHIAQRRTAARIKLRYDQNRPQRPMSLQFRQEVQKVLRAG